MIGARSTCHMCLRAPSHQDLHRHAHSKRRSRKKKCKLFCASRRHRRATVQGGWTTCARVRRLSMPIACLSSAMASGSHGTGHGVAVGRGRSGNRLSCVGRFFRFRPLLSDLELQQASSAFSHPPPLELHRTAVVPTLYSEQPYSAVLSTLWIV